MPQLTWLGDAEAKRAARCVPYRMLETVSVHGDANSPNCLIQGDNLEALKALLPYYAGRVKCIFIDPPYNTKSAFEHYDDNLEHSEWLSMMYPRLEMLRDLLSENGSIWVTIDDNESHYLKAVLDEVFGRKNFVANVVWQSSDNSNNDAKSFSVDHNHILVYSRSDEWLPKKLESVEDKRSHFRNPDNDPRGAWFDGNPLNSPKPRENLMYNLVAPNGNVIKFPKNGWRWERETIQEKLASGEIRFNASMTGIIRRTYLADMKGLPPSTLWVDLLRTGHNRQAKSEQKALAANGDVELFSTPKPEKLLREILLIATEEGDLVLDSFLGSGTTAAVAQKMNRRWIGVEMGAHATTHCLPRLEKVIQGEQGGISGAVGWAGGGGFRFMTLGETAFQADGRINPAVRFPALANYIWFLEAGQPHTTGRFDSPVLGVIGAGETATAYLLLFNGILGDRRPEGGNVLTTALWPTLRNLLPEHRGRWVIYGEASRIPESRRRAAGIEFKQIPYDIRMK